MAREIWLGDYPPFADLLCCSLLLSFVLCLLLQEYMQRCLGMITAGQCVVPAMQLLRDIIMQETPIVPSSPSVSPALPPEGPPLPAASFAVGSAPVPQVIISDDQPF